jgi:hypothetical protein
LLVVREEAVSVLEAKRLGLLREVVPAVATVAVLLNPTSLGEIERAVAAMARQADNGLIVMPDSFTLTHREAALGVGAQQPERMRRIGVLTRRGNRTTSLVT